MNKKVITFHTPNTETTVDDFRSRSQTSIHPIMHTSHRGKRTRQDLAAEATAASAEATSTPVQEPPRSSPHPKRRRLQKRPPIADGDDAFLQSALSPGRAAQRRSLKPTPTAITDLPEHVILMIYKHILETTACSQGITAIICGSRALRLQPLPRTSLSAHALALTSPVFASAFRRECIRGVVFRGACNAGVVGDAVERFERMQSLTVEKPRWAARRR